MPSSSLRGSVGPYKTVNLYCNTCDSQIGIYENEWIRPTTSYVIPKEKGTNFAINVAEKSQTADGKNIGALSGCALSEASCANCSKGLGQYCRTAPGKEHLVSVTRPQDFTNMLTSVVDNMSISCRRHISKTLERLRKSPSTLLLQPICHPKTVLARCSQRLRGQLSLLLLIHIAFRIQHLADPWLHPTLASIMA